MKISTKALKVLQEIEERERFLEDMRKLGQATKYEKSVKAEIALVCAMIYVSCSS